MPISSAALCCIFNGTLGRYWKQDTQPIGNAAGCSSGGWFPNRGRVYLAQQMLKKLLSEKIGLGLKQETVCINSECREFGDTG